MSCWLTLLVIFLTHFMSPCQAGCLCLPGDVRVKQKQWQASSTGVQHDLSFAAAQAFISATWGSWRWAQLYSRVLWLLYSSKDALLLSAYLWICNPVRCVSPLPWELLRHRYLDISVNNWVIFRTHQCCPVMAIKHEWHILTKALFLNQNWIMCS